MTEADKDGDEKLNCEEVLNYLKYGDILSCVGEQPWFKSLDKNNDGFLNEFEIDEDYLYPKSTKKSFFSVMYQTRVEIYTN